MAFRFQPLFSYAFKDRLNENSDRDDILQFFQDIKSTKDQFVLQQVKNIHVDYPDQPESGDPTHIVMKEVRYHNLVRRMVSEVPELKIIGLVRHPCAVIDSWIRAPREFKPDWDVRKEWRTGESKNQGRPEEFYGFDKWKEVAQLFIDLERERPEQVRVVRYAHLNNEPYRVARELFDFAELSYTASTEAFIADSRSRSGSDANSVYREERPDTAWIGRLPEYIGDTILQELAGTELEQFL